MFLLPVLRAAAPRNAATSRHVVCLAALMVAATIAGVQAQDAAAPAPAVEAPPAAKPAIRPTPVDPKAVVAKVGSATVTEGDIAIARQEFGDELGRVPAAQQNGVLVDAVVNMQILAQAAEEEKLDTTPEFASRLDFLRLQALRNAYVEKNIVNGATPDELQKAYQTMVVGQFKPEEQVRARHILVDSEDAAKKIIADLKGGAKFEDLAKQSKDPSGQNGGDLGYFGRGQMVPPFEESAFKLEPGQITDTPVKSEFGWHVIKVEDKRMSQPPSLAEVENELKSFLLRQKFEQTMTALKAKYPVELTNSPPAPPAAPTPDAAPLPDAAPAPDTAPAPAQP